VNGEVEGEVVEANHRASGQRDAALDDVLQLAHVAWPVVGAQGRQGAPRDPAHVLLELPRVLANEVLHEDGDVFLALAQGRDRQGGHVDPVEEVLAEGAGSNELAEILVGRGDHPHIHRDGAGAPEPFHLALLQRAQELGLEVHAQAPHLVEEQGAAVGQLELAELARVRAGEGALLVAEQLGLEEAVGDGSEVHRHEGLVAPGALAVDRARHQLLARSALPAHEHGGVSLGDLRDLLVEPDHGGMAAHQRVEAVRAVELGAKIADLALEDALLGGLLDEEQELVHVEGLDDVVVGARLDRVHRGAHVGHRGHEDDRDGVVEGEEPGQHRRPVLAGQAYVEHGHVHAARAHEAEPGGTVLGLQHLEITPEDLPQGLADPGLVVDHEDDGERAIDVSGIGLGGHGVQGLPGSAALSTTYSLPPPPRWT
jgi:hypothetical protein